MAQGAVAGGCAPPPPLRSKAPPGAAALPLHRYPFLLVDRVLEWEYGKFAVGYKCVTINDNFFPGHFPQRAIMPGAAAGTRRDLAASLGAHRAERGGGVHAPAPQQLRHRGWPGAMQRPPPPCAQVCSRWRLWRSWAAS